MTLSIFYFSGDDVKDTDDSDDDNDDNANDDGFFYMFM